MPFSAVTIQTDTTMNVTISLSDSDASNASGATKASVKSTIYVEILPEDLDTACNADCTPERCDSSTVRPREPPAVERGPPGSFVPFDVPARAREIRGLPAAPLDLFFRYVPRDLVEKWVSWTNAAPV
ncbi:transposable element-derived protein [Colletotrichum truncatum]|uniref:Transposable element-derived protein n=1 Tax=Colletotrichum truncatum TaxID=5467 RepID=A0ACC3YRA3_COLTU|nr:transposable element-derived protein [Colletotrichum truncatum]KAF6799157.1 transposable element-derived protein [Colletotrichum truncatum]